MVKQRKSLRLARKVNLVTKAGINTCGNTKSVRMISIAQKIAEVDDFFALRISEKIIRAQSQADFRQALQKSHESLEQLIRNRGHQKGKAWKSNQRSQPSPNLEDGEEIEKRDKFTTVVHRNGTARSRQGDTIPIGSWRTSASQRSGMGQTPSGAPYPPTGSRSRTTLVGAVEKSYQQSANLSRQGGQVSQHPSSTFGRLTLKAHPKSCCNCPFVTLRQQQKFIHSYPISRSRHITTKKNRAADRAEYKPGIIFYAMLHQEHWAGEDAPVEESVTRTNNGIIHSKNVPLLSSSYTMHIMYHFLSSPTLGTVGNRASDEFVSIYDPRSWESKLQQSQHPTLFTGNMLPNTYR